MPKTTDNFKMISDLVGEITLAVSGGKDATAADYVPAMGGFVIRVTFANGTEKMRAALNSTRIAVQGTLRSYYRKHKRFPFQPGKVQAVSGSGEFELPVATHVDKLEAGLVAGSVTLIDKIRLVEAMGLVVPEAWRNAHDAENDAHQDAGEDADADAPMEQKGLNGPNAPSSEYRFNESDLRRISTTKLIELCQEEKFENIDKMTRKEMITMLVELEG